MIRYADPHLCPDCHAALPVEPTACPSCDLPLRHPLVPELFRTLQLADTLLVRIRATPVPATATATPTTGNLTPYPVPSPTPVRRHGIRTASVPTILLGLGALCLIVAAITFLAVAWSWMGIGGRTAVLLGLTAIAAAAGRWLGRRGLRVAAESLTTVSLGLVALDVTGAITAGWFGSRSDGASLALLGAGVACVSAVLLATRSRLVSPQLGLALGTALAGIGSAVTGHPRAVVVGTVLLLAALAHLARRTSLAPLAISAAVLAGVGWAWLLAVGLDDATSDPSWHGFWIDGDVAALLAAALLPLLLRHRVAVAGSLGLLTAVLALPVTDEGGTAVVATATAVLLAAALVPNRWRDLAAGPALMAALPGLPLAALAIGDAAARVAEAGTHLAAPDPAFHPLLLVPLVLSVAAAARPYLPVPIAAGLLAAAAVATLASYAVPLAIVVASLAVLALAVARLQPVAAVAVALLAVAAALPSAGLTASACAAAVVVALLLGRHLLGGILLPTATAGLLWSAAAAWSLDVDLRAVPILLVVGALAVALPRIEVELSAATAGVVASLVVVDDPTSLAIHLTVAGALVTVSSLVHADRRPLAWAGGLLLAAATWVRLADLGVEAPEAYTLPSALVLLAVGLERMRRDPAAGTTTLLPGLTLATVPSLLWVLVDPITPRAVLLGAACLGLVLAGAHLRWSTPIAVGGLVGALAVVRELAPYAGATPQWVLIGLAGAVLTLVGVTWEQRMLELRRAADYLGRLR